MANNYLTFHVLNALPMHSANRDDNGAPKTIRQGNVERGMLSAQSLKRAARTTYEEQIGRDRTYRSAKHLANAVLERVRGLAAEQNVTLDEDKVTAKIAKDIQSLVANADKPEGKAKTSTDSAQGADEAPAGKGPKDTNVWLSGDELGALAEQALRWFVDGANDQDTILGDLGLGKRTGALGIAAFGRMFANANDRQTEAAIAVSPAVTTHPANIDVDYFTVVDDLGTDHSGASYLDVSQYTNGVYYRTFTIDREQLARSWSDLHAPDAPERLGTLIRSLIYGLPRGKRTTTAPFTPPLIVLVEEQSVRQAYTFEQPVDADPEVGGFTAPSVQALIDQHNAARTFDPTLFSNTFVAATVDHPAVDGAVEASNLEVIIDHAVQWARAGGQSK